MKAYILVKAEVGKADKVMGELEKNKGFSVVDLVAGPYDLIVQVEGNSPDDISDKVINVIHKIEGVKETTTCFVVSSLKRAFTLIEIMVVVLIIGLLAGLVGINVMRYFDKAKIKTVQAQLSMIEQALELYKLENGRYPTTDEGLAALAKGGYIKGNKIPKDPWGSDYYYISDGTTFSLKSPGPDKTPGTEDDISLDTGEKAEM